METLLLILGLFLFVALVVVHEWGHFIMARRNGVDVEEFGIGFPPKLFKFYKDSKGTEYTINLLPLGGFVRLKGEHDADKQKGAYGAANFLGKTKIILAGVAMNLFVAWLMFTLLALIGMPKLPLPGGEEQFTVASDTKVVSNRVIVGYVEPGGPASTQGLEPGMEIVSASCSNESTLVSSITPTASTLRSYTEECLKQGGDTIGMIITRDDGKQDGISISPRSLEEVEISKSTDTPKGYLGVLPQDFTIQRSTWSAPIVGAGLIGQFTKLTYSAIGTSITGLFKGNTTQASENVSGPVGIFVILKDGASLGISYVLLIIASLSLTLAIMNTLPIPALDGGKLAVTAIFRLLKRPLTAKTEERIHGTGFMLLIGLFLLITIVDVRRFF